MDNQQAVIILYMAIMLSEHTLGWAYAWYIYHWPIRPTWVSVGYGCGLILISETLAIGGTLRIYGLLDELWFLVLIPFFGVMLPGIPMLILQQKKWIEMNKHNADVKEVWNDK